MLDAGAEARVVEVLEEARGRGFLGPGPVGDHVRHALGFAAVFEGDPGCLTMDLGSGGGVPGLVLALVWPTSTWCLLDANARRTTFLAEAAQALDLSERVRVVQGRAEEAGRMSEHRGRYGLVVARSFARPAVVAECAAPLLVVGGSLLVSDPPADDGRWEAGEIATVGLRHIGQVQAGSHVTHLRQEVLCPDRFPRRVGIPSKRPLW